MNIEMSKNIKLNTLEILAEVDFFKESPYIELLESFESKEELIVHLVLENFEKATIDNILNRFEKLGIFKDDSIIDLKQGFPEREFGKYLITFCSNDTHLPFKYKKYNLERKSYTEENRIDSVDKIDKDLMVVLISNDDRVQNKKFRILKIIDDQAIIQKTKKINEKLSITFDSENWNYTINNISFEMQPIDLKAVFKGEWNEKFQAKEQQFDEIKDNHSAIVNFQRTYKDNVEIEDYGHLEATFTNIPLIPTENCFKEWFLYLLKNKISSMDRYITAEETEQIWNNVYSKNDPINQRYEIPYDINEITNQYDKESDIFWFLMAGKDLNPFEIPTQRKEKSITIDEQINCNLEDVFNNTIHLHKAKSLLIIDRYINTLRHFKSLKELLKPYKGQMEVKIITTDYYEATNDEILEIEEICSSYRIDRIVRSKSNIPHDRFWIVDNKQYYTVSKSIDFIRVGNDGNINLKHTYFHTIDVNNSEPQVKVLIEEL